MRMQWLMIAAGLAMDFASAAEVREVAVSGAATVPSAAPAKRLAADDFRNGAGGWVIEQQSGGTVMVADGALVIDDKAGCTVWWRARLSGPLVIRYTATMKSGARISDLNCFWMATDPRTPEDLFAPGHGRDGRFATYDTLRTYYVGCGGNSNTTMRFRRYDGSGARPLLPEHDLKQAEVLLEAERSYRIEITAAADGRTTWARDGVVWLSYMDAEPLRSGWFGFRTVDSRIEIRDFSVERLTE
jgi:Domain of unknown function (DUF6250)